jgi:3-oxoacyl-(acyl-carrier-protein) synthase
MFAVIMAGTDIYINGSSCISPQETFDTPDFLSSPIHHSGKFLQVLQPDYKSFIKPIQLRRMAKLIRMGIATAKKALQEAELEIPDAIVTGTGVGSVTDTEKFLNMMLESNEQMASPSSFINSTHNTVGAHIAVMLGCHDHNLNYVHYSTAFESALIDAIMLFQEGSASNVLAGGLDEQTEENYNSNRFDNIWKKPVDNILNLFHSPTPGVIPGESAAFFLLSNKHKESTYARLLDVQSFFNPATPDQLRHLTENMLARHGLSTGDIDVVLAGFNGDPRNDSEYRGLIDSLFPDAFIAAYKHLSGEHKTASAFAMWCAARILKKQYIPEVLKIRGNSISTVKNVLIYNFNFKFFNNHSFILLSL